MMRTDGERVDWFLRTYCVHTKGQWAGQPIALEPWQRAFVDELFAVDKHGRRIYTEGLLGIPRKNGKSTIASGLGYYMLTDAGDNEPGSEVYSGAGSKDQARITLDPARKMVKQSPKLNKIVSTYRDEIRCDRNGGVWKVVAHDGDLQQGSNPHLAIIDELHVHKTDALYNAFAAGTGARRAPLLVAITTAGANLGSPLGNIYSQALKMPDIERPTPYLTIARDPDAGFLMYWYGLPDGYEGELETDEALNGCNPASWATPEFLRRQRAKPSMREADWLRFHMNAWTTGDGDGISAAEWDACYAPDATIPDGAPAFSATDLAFTGDWAAHVIAAPVHDRIVLQAQGWAPPADRTMEIDIRATVGAYAEGEAQRLEMRQMAFDEWNSRLLMQEFAAMGLPVVAWSMKPSFMCPASEAFLEAVRTRRIAHNGDPVLRQQVLALRTRDVGGSGWKFDKHPQNDVQDWKTDVALAAVAATYLASADQGNALEEFGLFL
jgi:phage terminase large subunit-like protein